MKKVPIYKLNNFKMSEENDAVQQSKIKAVVFTNEERKLILKLVNMHYDVLYNSKTDSVSIQLKNQAWEKIHEKYVQNTGIVQLPRTPQQLRRCWENVRARAKKGNPMCVKLLRWAEMQYKIMVIGKNNRMQDIVFESSPSLVNEKKIKEETDFKLLPQGVENKSSSIEDTDLEPPIPIEPLEEESEFNNREEIDCGENQSEVGEPNVRSSKLMNSLLDNIKLLESSNCIHCSCEKAEKNAKIHLLALQQQQNEELHQLQIQMAREKMRHEKELQKLYIHEMTLKIENERRRAEILDRELNN